MDIKVKKNAVIHMSVLDLYNIIKNKKSKSDEEIYLMCMIHYLLHDTNDVLVMNKVKDNLENNIPIYYFQDVLDNVLKDIDTEYFSLSIVLYEKIIYEYPSIKKEKTKLPF
jgi:hypothetical protein